MENVRNWIKAFPRQSVNSQWFATHWKSEHHLEADQEFKAAAGVCNTMGKMGFRIERASNWNCWWSHELQTVGCFSRSISLFLGPCTLKDFYEELLETTCSIPQWTEIRPWMKQTLINCCLNVSEHHILYNTLQLCSPDTSFWYGNRACPN